MKLRIAAIFTVVLTGTAFLWAAAAATSCESLASLVLPKAKIDSAQSVAAGAFRPPGNNQRGGNAFAGLPAFCRVTATLTPSSDSDIKIEVWLPASGWNGKFQAVGNGGWAGTIPYPAMAAALARGYAGGRHRHGPRRRQRRFRARDIPRSWSTSRYRVDSRDDGAGQGRHQRPLRQRADSCPITTAARRAAGRA